MIGLNREIIRVINYVTEEQTIIISFITAYALNPEVLFTLQNMLNTLTTLELEVIITRSLFDIEHRNHRVYRANDLSDPEINLLTIHNATGVLVRRINSNNFVQIDYEWFS